MAYVTNIIGFLTKMFSKTIILLLLVITFFISNVLTLMNQDFHDFLYNGLKSLPLSQFLSNSPTNKRKQLTKEKQQLSSTLKKSERKIDELSKNNHKLKKENNLFKTNKSNLKRLTKNIAQRTVKNISINVASIPAESIAYIGTGVVIAVTALDIKDACNTMKDMNEVRKYFDFDELNDEESEVCGYKNNYTKQYTEMKKNVKLYFSELKNETMQKYKKFNNATGDIIHHEIEKYKGNINIFYDRLGGTIDVIINE